MWARGEDEEEGLMIEAAFSPRGQPAGQGSPESHGCSEKDRIKKHFFECFGYTI